MTQLQINNLSVAFEGRTILDNIELTFPDAGVVSVLGRNGAGKTTLLRCLAGLATPNLGQVNLQNKPLPQWGQLERARQIAWIPQSSYVPFSYRCLDLVILGRYPWHLGLPQKHDFHRAQKAMQKLGVDQLATRTISELSSGELQRVFLARVLASDATILVLDEPCANLDLHSSLQLIDHLRELTSQHSKLVICSVHDMNLALRLSDYAIGMVMGKQLFFGPKSDVLTGKNFSKLLDVQVGVVEKDGYASVVTPLNTTM